MRIFAVGVLCLLNVSCATMFNNGSQSIVATGSSKEEKIPVVVTTPDGSYEAELPTTIVTSPSTFQDVTIEVKETKCTQARTIKVKKQITPSYWANILNVWGLAIDPFTGAMWKYDNRVSVPVVSKGSCAH